MSAAAVVGGALSSLALALALTLIALEIFRREKITVMSFLHVKWVSPIFLLSYGALLLFAAHIVGGFTAGALHESLLLAALSALVGRNLVALAFFIVHRWEERAW